MNPGTPAAKAPAVTVLIVEDNALVAKFYRMALERAGGFACLVTEDVAEMLAAIDGGQAQVALVDVSLSRTEWQGRPIDGVELTRLLKERAASRAGRKLPVLLATAHAMTGDRERLLETSGADDYLEKPVYDVALLISKLRTLLDSSSS